MVRQKCLFFRIHGKIFGSLYVPLPSFYKDLRRFNKDIDSSFCVPNEKFLKLNLLYTCKRKKDMVRIKNIVLPSRDHFPLMYFDHLTDISTQGQRFVN